MVMNQHTISTRGARIVAMRTAHAMQMMAAFNRRVVPVDPCVKCRYRGMCDADDCAMHCFDLDVNVSPVK